MTLEEDVQSVERSLAILHEQLLQCQTQIDHLSALRQRVEQNPTEYFRSAFACKNSIPLPSPIVVHKISANTLGDLPSNWNSSLRNLAPHPLPDKISVKKARRLPGYRVLQQQNLDFARNWKDDEKA